MIIVISTTNKPGKISKSSRGRTNRSASLTKSKEAHRVGVAIQAEEVATLEVVEVVDEAAMEAIEDEGGHAHEVQAGVAEVEDKDEAEARQAKAPTRVLRLLAQP